MTQVCEDNIFKVLQSRSSYNNYFSLAEEGHEETSRQRTRLIAIGTCWNEQQNGDTGLDMAVLSKSFQALPSLSQTEFGTKISRDMSRHHISPSIHYFGSRRQRKAILYITMTLVAARPPRHPRIWPKQQISHRPPLHEHSATAGSGIGRQKCERQLKDATTSVQDAFPKSKVLPFVV